MAYLLHQLLTQSAERLPEHEAARFQGDSLSYSELEEQTNQLARALCKAGVRRGDRVGIYTNKSLASIIGVFGILKAGAAYVPLDPAAPIKRLGFISRNCDIKVLLTSSAKSQQVGDLLEEGAPLESIFLLDRAVESIEVPATIRVISFEAVQQEPKAHLQILGANETDLAYILYTSGSTGDPKGVMITHRTILTFIDWCHHQLRIHSEDRVTSHAPLHFDLSTFDIYATIQAGGTVVLVPEKYSIFPIQLVRLLQDEKITVTYLVPSILSLMVDYGKLSGHDLTSLRMILFAGEVFPIKYLRKLVELIPHAEYYNLYGPTETNVCTYYRVRPEDLAPERTEPVPIGIACENMEVFAVNDAGELVTEPGGEGELWVRGACVARGYWGDPEKTAKVFVRNPFQPNFEEIVYRTGDLIRLEADGRNWRYLGRRDHMIKSRGYRIELGEIEAAIYALEGVKEAAVVAVPDELIGSRIKAYIVLANGQPIGVKELQAHCSNYLPRYMVPESFEFRQSLPKTSTGKIDRRQLAQT